MGKHKQYHFYLKDKNSLSPTSINLTINKGTFRRKIAIGMSILPEWWDGSYDVHNIRNHHKIEGYALRTIGADFGDTEQDVDAFVQYVEEHPKKTFLVKKVGIQKANIPIESIAPLFKPLKNAPNVFLPMEFRQYLDNDN